MSRDTGTMKNVTNSALAAMTGAVLVLSVGCSGQTEDVVGTPSAVSTAPTSTPSPTDLPSTPAAMSNAEAGQTYLSLVEGANAATESFNTAVDSQDPAAIRVAAAAAVPAFRAFADGLSSHDWPAAVVSTVDTLVGELAADIQALGAIAAATTDADLQAEMNAFPVASGAGQKMRILLGLPDAPTS